MWVLFQYLFLKVSYIFFPAKAQEDSSELERKP